jgi:hypothetical protein
VQVGDATKPDARLAVAVLVLLVGVLVGVLEQLVLVAVVRFVVEHDDLPFAGAEALEDPRGHQLGRLSEGVRQAGPAAAQEFAGRRRDALDLLGVLRQERVVVDDLYLRLQHGFPEVRRNQVALAVAVCHAISIAITTVLPEPVAIFRATRGSPSLCSAFSGSSRRR